MLGIDSLREADGRFIVKQYSGRPDATVDAGRETIAWAREATALGAGEIVLNCMDRDGVRRGYDLDQLVGADRGGRCAGDRLGRRGDARSISPPPSAPGRAARSPRRCFTTGSSRSPI